MGMTDICPGTHYCGNDLGKMCENTKLSLADADPSGPHFRAGDGALLNQIVWHRGAAHKGKNAMERIVFIVSFLARPDMQHDPRQLSRGTYFHQRWVRTNPRRRYYLFHNNLDSSASLAPEIFSDLLNNFPSPNVYS